MYRLNVAMIRDTFVALWCSPIHAEPTGFAVSIDSDFKDESIGILIINFQSFLIEKTLNKT
jgi:hypothetical protein